VDKLKKNLIAELQLDEEKVVDLTDESVGAAVQKVGDASVGLLPLPATAPAPRCARATVDQLAKPVLEKEDQQDLYVVCCL
jgi:hypothetical protein